MLLTGQRLVAKELQLFAFGCVHYGCGQHNAALFQAFLERVESTPNAVVWGLGDYFDFARTAHRDYLAKWGESTDSSFGASIDAMVDTTLIDPFCDLIYQHAPSLPSKIQCLTEGNHSYTYLSGPRQGQTSTQVLCQKLGIPYGGHANWTRLSVIRSLSKSGRKGTSHNLNVLCHHGTGGGQYLSSALGKLERQTFHGWDGLDILFSSHSHQLGHLVTQKIGVSQRGQPRMYTKSFLVAKTGCFKKAYTDDATHTSYEERRLFLPQAQGWFECRAKIHYAWEPQRARTNYEYWVFDAFNH